jgi:hypothetical protein
MSSTTLQGIVRRYIKYGSHAKTQKHLSTHYRLLLGYRRETMVSNQKLFLQDMGHTGKSDRAEAPGPMAEAPGPMAEAPGPAGGRVCKSIADKITAPDSPTKLLAGIAKTVRSVAPWHNCYARSIYYH